MNLKQVPSNHDCMVDKLLSYCNTNFAKWLTEKAAMTCHREDKINKNSIQVILSESRSAQLSSVLESKQM